MAVADDVLRIGRTTPVTASTGPRYVPRGPAGLTILSAQPSALIAPLAPRARTGCRRGAAPVLTDPSRQTRDGDRATKEI